MLSSEQIAKIKNYIAFQDIQTTALQKTEAVKMLFSEQISNIKNSVAFQDMQTALQNTEMPTASDCKRIAIIGGAGLAVAVAAPVVVGAATTALGFTSGGIAAGSTGATMMSWGAGTTPAVVSVLQSVGAAGIAGTTQVCAGVAASTTAAVASWYRNEPSHNQDNKSPHDLPCNATDPKHRL